MHTKPLSGSQSVGSGRHGWGFAAGVVLVTVGVLLQLPDGAMMLAGSGDPVESPQWTADIVADATMLRVGPEKTGTHQ